MTYAPSNANARLIFAGAVTIATLALFGAASPASAATAPNSESGRVIAVDDDSSAPPGDTGGGVNDQGQTSGDTFTQNAQDQSTA
jgi:hypothetical protein